MSGIGVVEFAVVAAFFVLVAVVVFLLVRRTSRSHNAPPPGGPPELETLKERYARGEIERDEYERTRRDIES
ncbi:MAG: SHOCT domain-containing protein [Rubrobacter sp.]|nr:SHOCT domain-containing protein [Rubrobacter sp.]